MAAPDPVDIRLLSLVAEMGKAAVHEIAGRLGMDPREVAARLVALSATGLPLIVGVECDPHGLRNAIAGAGAWMNYAAQNYAQGGNTGPQGTPSGAYPVATPPGGGYGASSGPYPPPQQRGYGPPPGGSGPHPGVVPGPGSGPQAGGPQSGGSGPHPGATSGSWPPAVVQAPPVPSTPFPAPGADAISTWGPPQSSSWARGDQPTRPAWTAPPSQATAGPAGGSGQHAVAASSGGGEAPGHRGRVGETLHTEGLEGEQVAIQLVEVVDPADFLFTAAGYRLREGERAVVVHTELTNRGSVPFPTLPDLYLVLVAKDGQSIGKAPVSLSSRPPHRIGVPPGETAGGHTVYVLPDTTEITSVRWTPRPDDETHALTWAVEA